MTEQWKTTRLGDVAEDLWGGCSQQPGCPLSPGDKHAGVKVFGEVSGTKCWKEAQINANVERRQCSVCGAAARSCSKHCSHYAQTLCRWYFASSARDHCGGVSSVEVQSEKLQRKEQSVFKQQGREPTPAYFHGKGLQDVSFLSVGKQEIQI